MTLRIASPAFKGRHKNDQEWTLSSVHFPRRIPFFKQLENAIVGKLAGVAKLADGGARSIMLVQGTKISDEVSYILLKGSVAIHILRSAASPDPHAFHMLLSHRPRDLDEHKQAFLKLLEDDNEHPSNGHSREKQGQGQTAHQGRLIPFARFAERKNVLGHASHCWAQAIAWGSCP